MAYSHTAIVVADIAESELFYREVFGFTSADGPYQGSGPELDQILGTTNAHIDGVFMSCSGFVIELLHYRGIPDEAGRTKATQLGYAHLSFVVDSVSERMNLAARCGGTASHESRTEVRFGSGGPVVIGFVNDPSGNSIELIEHSDGAAASDHARFLNAASLGWPPTA